MTTTIGSLDLGALTDLRDDVTQHFWFESNSSSAWGSGAHVTLYPESQFTDPNNANYLKGQNILMNTDGFSIRNGALPMMVLDNDSLDFNTIDIVNSTYTNVASFGASTRIGETNSNRVEIDNSKIQFQSPTNLMFRVKDNGNVFSEYVDLPVETDPLSPDLGKPIFVWESGATGQLDGYVDTTAEIASVNDISNIHLEFTNIAQETTVSIDTNGANPYTSSGYTVSYSTFGGDQGFDISITKNISESGVVELSACHVTYTTGFNTSSTSCGTYSEADDPDYGLAQTFPFVVGVGTGVNNKKNGFYVDYNGNCVVSGELTAWYGLTSGGDVTFLQPQDVFVVETYNHTYSSVSSGNNMDWTENMEKPGYYPIGVMGVYLARAALCVTQCRIYNRDIGSCTLRVNARAVANVGGTTGSAQILWVKAT